MTSPISAPPPPPPPPPPIGPGPSLPPDIIALYNNLQTQSQHLLHEVLLFAEHISTSPLVARPDILLNRYQNDVVREAKLLQLHGTSVGLVQHHNDPSDPALAPLAPGNSSITSKTVETRLGRIARSDLSHESRLHGIRSSNTPFLAALWGELKSSTGVTAIRKPVRYAGTQHPRGPSHTSTKVSGKRNRNARDRAPGSSGSGGVQRPPPPPPAAASAVSPTVSRKDKEPVVVDVICEHGAKWVKLFTKTFEWLVMDMAREGVVWDGDTGVECDDGDDEERHEGLEELKIVKMAREVVAASRTARVGIRHEHPDVWFYLTKIDKGRGCGTEVHLVLEYLKSVVGVKVLMAGEMRDSLEGKGDEGSLRDVFGKMICEPPAVTVTATLNIDCTVLIALISDISHSKPENIRIPDHYEGRPALDDIKSQLASEPTDPLLPGHIYPIIRGKKLVCTSTAAAHLRNIVQVMGSPGETKRSRIFLPVGPDDKRQSTQLRQQLEQLTVHEIPEDLHLPVEVIEDDSLVTGHTSQNLEQVIMQRISRHPRLSPLNRSVFFHGWTKQLTTVSLNKVVCDWLKRTIDSTLDEIEAGRGVSNVVVEEDFCGPNHLICGRERSLLGNEKCTHSSGRICKGQCHHG